jgi:hypothetical protein
MMVERQSVELSLGGDHRGFVAMDVAVRAKRKKTMRVQGFNP